MAGRIAVSLLSILVLAAGCSDLLSSGLQDKVELEENSTPVPGGGGLLSVVEARAAAVDISWQAAVDAHLTQERLQYRLYCSTGDNLDTVQQVLDNGTPAMAWTANIEQGTAAGLSVLTMYYFNLLVRDRAGNLAAYGGTSSWTLDDTINPTPGGTGTLGMASIGKDSVTVTWLQGSDDITLSSGLQYMVYYSLSGNIASVLEAEGNGISAGPYSTAVDSKAVGGLSDATLYYFNVLLRDEVGNRNAYTMSSATTARGSRVYWADFGTDKIQRARLDGSGQQDLLTGAVVTTFYGVAVDNAADQLYWTDVGGDAIYSMSVNGGSTTTLISSGMARSRAIALDTVNGDMYWTDEDNDKIYCAPLTVTGGNAADYEITGLSGAGVDAPRGIALDLVAGKMYWVEAGATKRIRRANLDGSSVENLVLTSLTDPFGLALTSSYLYWTDVGTGPHIERALRTSFASRAVLINTNISYPVDLAMDETGNAMYWTDAGTHGIYKSSLLPGSTDAATYLVSGIAGLSSPVGIDLELQ